jgi:ligand-binding sensor domain-containing protein
MLKIEKTYWLATNQGVYLFNSETLNLTSFNTQSSPAIVGDEVRSLTQDYLGRLWFGTSTGISIYDRTNNSVFSFNDKNNINFGLENGYLLKIFTDSKETIWLGTYSGGIYKHNPKAAKIELFQKSTNQKAVGGNIWGIDQDSNGRIWLATQTDGLSVFDPYDYTFKHYLEDFSHNIWDLLIDEQNRIWVASSGGLYIYAKNNVDQL